MLYNRSTSIDYVEPEFTNACIKRSTHLNPKESRHEEAHHVVEDGLGAGATRSL
jgi:hypothetical protein